MELKTDRDPILPSLPTEEEKGDFDRISRLGRDNSLYCEIL